MREFMSKIRFSSNILKRLGEELNPGIEKGILELVKNAYDADAESCVVDIGSGEIGGTLTVSDDGDGMDINDIDEGWLVLGNSRKTYEATRLGRIPAGSKGLGRLAALRMGHKVEMTSVSRKNRNKQYSLVINWDYYDREDLVDNVELTINSRINEGKTTGTEIKILELRDTIHRADIKKLAREMVLLADPFSDVKNSFNPVLVAPEFEDLEKLVQRRYFDDAEYYLEAELSNSEECTLSVKDWLGNVLFSGSMNNLKGSPYKTIPFRFEIWTFILTNKNFINRTVTISEIKTWLKDFGGIHFYQNGLRVSPYGDKGNDWLDLNLQRVRSPEERPSTNNTIGRVSVIADESVLIPKTDRSGFIENETFRELHRFCTDALDWMAKERLAQAEKRRAKDKKEVPEALKKTKNKMLNVINTAESEDKDKLQKAFTAYDKARQKEADALQNELLLYRTLSTAGITAATFAHEMLGEHLKNGSLYINILKNKIRKETQINSPQDYLDKLNKISSTFEAIKIPGQTTLSLIEHEKRRKSKIDVHNRLNKLVAEFQAFYESRDTKVSTDFLQDQLFIHATISAFESIIVNLIVNALTALEQINNQTRTILIETRKQNSEEVEISVTDNGPGITGIDIKDIWLPGQTTRKNGTGLGLTIVKDTVKDLGGTIEVQAKTDFGGAQFTVTLPTI